MDVHVHALFLLSAAILNGYVDPSVAFINGNVDPSENYPECMNDGLAYNVSNEGYCFWLSPYGYSDVELAKDFCQSGGGELAIIPDSTLGRFVANLIVSKGSPYTSYKFFVGYTVANYILRRNTDQEEQSWASWKNDLSPADKCVAVGLESGELFWYQKGCTSKSSKSAVCSSVISQENVSETTPNESTSTTESKPLTNSTPLLTYFNTSEVSTRIIHTVTNRGKESISYTTNPAVSISFQSTPTNLATLSSQNKSTSTNMSYSINESMSSTTVSTPVVRTISKSTERASHQTTKLSTFENGANTVTAPPAITTHTSHLPSNVSSSKDSNCTCSCQYFTREVNVSTALQKRMERIKKELAIDKSTLSSVKRRKISADDPRPSATYVGSLGILVLVLVFAGMILLDSEEILKFLYTIALKCKV